MKHSEYLNADGTFKGGFDGCVLHMTQVEGHSEESAKKICGHIAQQVGAKELLAPIGAEIIARRAREEAEGYVEIICRMAVAAPDTAIGEFMAMPGGRHTIYAGQATAKGIKDATINVLVDRSSAAAMQQQLRAVIAKGPQIPYCDFNHNDEEASFWPAQYVWRDAPQPGVYVQGEWSASGRAAIEGKMYRSFSPVFYVDDPKGEPAKVVMNPKARLNFGGLVNKPAFRENLPFWAKPAGA